MAFEAYGPGAVLLGTIVASDFNDDNYAGGKAEDRFFGWADPGGIAAITIRSTVHPSPWGYDPNHIEIDHLQYGAVPEPGSIAVLSMGLAGLAWSRRRRAA